MFRDQLIEEGISETRTESIIKALDTLHTALVELDGRNLEIFLNKNIVDRINDFAKSEGLAIITPDKTIAKYYENQKLFEKLLETKRD